MLTINRDHLSDFICNLTMRNIPNRIPYDEEMCAGKPSVEELHSLGFLDTIQWYRK